MNANVLIVDDSRTVRMMLRSTLESAGHHVTEAYDGVNAIATLQNVKPDLIITDVNMPEMDGITLVRELRNRPDLPRIPILILTTVTDQEMKEKGVRPARPAGCASPSSPTNSPPSCRKC